MELSNKEKRAAAAGASAATSSLIRKLLDQKAIKNKCREEVFEFALFEAKNNIMIGREYYEAISEAIDEDRDRRNGEELYTPELIAKMLEGFGGFKA